MQINVHDLAHAKGVPTAAREAMLLMQERITELEAENAQLKAMQADDGELLTIAYMDGSHRSTKAHRAKMAQQDAVIAGLVEALEPFAKAGRIKLCGGDYWTGEKSIQGTDIAFHIKFADLRAADEALTKAKESRDV